ncbi:hypothetical protein F4802DRAFT_129232 [Xylaria palmicola]|nr:hypothetical protein F4802DRAFT_129232 [Xylaria palmicola]
MGFRQAGRQGISACPLRRFLTYIRRFMGSLRSVGWKRGGLRQGAEKNPSGACLFFGSIIPFPFYFRAIFYRCNSPHSLINSFIPALFLLSLEHSHQFTSLVIRRFGWRDSDCPAVNRRKGSFKARDERKSGLLVPSICSSHTTCEKSVCYLGSGGGV